MKRTFDFRTAFLAFFLVSAFQIGQGRTEEYYNYQDEDGAWHFTNAPESVGEGAEVMKMDGHEGSEAMPSNNSLGNRHRLAVRKKIKKIQDRLEAIQMGIGNVMSWRGQALGDIRRRRGILLGITEAAAGQPKARVLYRFHEGKLQQEEEQIKAEAEQALDKLRYEREILTNRLAELRGQLENY